MAARDGGGWRHLYAYARLARLAEERANPNYTHGEKKTTEEHLERGFDINDQCNGENNRHNQKNMNAARINELVHRITSHSHARARIRTTTSTHIRV